MLDHLLWGVPDLDQGIRAFAEHSGVHAAIGGRHSGAGTHNALLDLEDDRYLEIIAPDPSQDRLSGFGLLLSDLSAPGLVTWAARTGVDALVLANARAVCRSSGEIDAMSRLQYFGAVYVWRLL